MMERDWLVDHGGGSNYGVITKKKFPHAVCLTISISQILGFLPFLKTFPNTTKSERLVKK